MVMGERVHTPAAGGRRRSWSSRLWDAAVVVALAAAAAAAWWVEPHLLSPLGVVLAATGIVSLAWRRAAPVRVLAVTVTVGVISAATGTGGVVVLPIAVACAAVVASGRRRLGILSAALSATVIVLLLVVRGAQWSSTLVVTVVLALALAVAAGLVQDGRRRIVQDAVDRAERAEALRAAEARRAVAEERLRIARDLHDVLAHHIAVIGVQTGLAEYVLTDDVPAAREALSTARTAGNAALRELASLLQLLRAGAADDPRTAPAPSLRRLDALLDDVRGTGMTVDAQVDDPLPDLPPVTDLAVYRVLQEGLTNVHKYGGGHAGLTVRASADRLEIRITNAVGVAAEAAPESGFGLIGMRERVTGVGGTLTAAAKDEVFVLEATVPIPHADADVARRQGGTP